MAYSVTKFQARFAGRLLPALTTLLERDANDALEEVNPKLTGFESYRLPTLLTTKFPALFVEAVRSGLEQSDDDAYIREQHEFDITLAITGADAFAVQQQLTEYVLALDRVLRSALPSDLIEAVTSETSGLVWEVTAHNFQLARVDSILRGDATLTVVIQLFER
jgi:hypothetical protein